MRFWIIEKGNVIFIGPTFKTTSENNKKIIAEAIIKALKERKRF